MVEVSGVLVEGLHEGAKKPEELLQVMAHGGEHDVAFVAEPSGEVIVGKAAGSFEVADDAFDVRAQFHEFSERFSSGVVLV